MVRTDEVAEKDDSPRPVIGDPGRASTDGRDDEAADTERHLVASNSQTSDCRWDDLRLKNRNDRHLHALHVSPRRSEGRDPQYRWSSGICLPGTGFESWR